MTQSPTATPLPPPSPPRPLSPLINRRAWTEPRVRLWWLIAAVLLLLITIFAIDRIYTHSQEAALISSGVPIDAKVIEANGISLNTKVLPPDAQVTLEFDWHGQPKQVQGTLEDRTDYIVIGKTVPIRVLADDPDVWTGRREPSPLIHELFLVFVLIPIVPICYAIAAKKKRRFLNTYRTGETAPGIVSDRRQTPIAPSSYAIRASLRDGPDKRLFTVYVPPSGKRLQRGDLLWLVIPTTGPKNRRNPLSAMWFE